VSFILSLLLNSQQNKVDLVIVESPVKDALRLDENIVKGTFSLSSYNIPPAVQERLSESIKNFEAAMEDLIQQKEQLLKKRYQEKIKK
jgi:hypothetical protein